MQHMHALDLTRRRRRSALVNPKRTPRHAVPRGQVSPGAEEVERTFLVYGVLVSVIRGKRGMSGRDELRGARVERLRGRGPDEGWFGAGWGAAWVSDAVRATNTCGVRKEET
jgi:hypothetical protein